MSLAENVRLNLELADRARAYYSARCHLDDADPALVHAFEELESAVKALDAYENPPAQVAVQAPSSDELEQLQEFGTACLHEWLWTVAEKNPAAAISAESLCSALGDELESPFEDIQPSVALLSLINDWMKNR
jgi:hypothetical protein